jgi:hypothetical protein
MIQIIKRYTLELGKREREYRKEKAKELGISLYELLGQQKACARKANTKNEKHTSV